MRESGQARKEEDADIIFLSELKPACAGRLTQTSGLRPSKDHFRNGPLGRSARRGWMKGRYLFGWMEICLLKWQRFLAGIISRNN